jgi:hypothetical protein
MSASICTFACRGRRANRNPRLQSLISGISEVSISLSGFRARAANSRRCALVSLVGDLTVIVFSFMLCGLPGRDDPDDFFTMAFMISVADSQNLKASHHAEDRPPLFAVHYAVRLDVCGGVLKCQLCSLESDIVFRAIGSVLIFIPGEAHQETVSTGARLRIVYYIVATRVCRCSRVTFPHAGPRRWTPGGAALRMKWASWSATV